LVFFGIKSYQSIEKEQEKYRNSKSHDENNKNASTPNKIKPETINSDKQGVFAGQKVFTYSSASYDIEMPNGSMITKNELTYHTFDFNK
jgi:hypothetical protein